MSNLTPTPRKTMETVKAQALETERSLRVLLIQPPVVGEVFSYLPQVDHDSSGIGYKPPLGILYLASTIQRFSSHRTHVIDCIAQKRTIDSVVIEIDKYQPDLVGISAWTDFWYPAYTLGKKIKDSFPEIHLTYGGPHIGIYPKETLELPFVDSVVAGDGEIPLLRLCSLIANSEGDPEFPGLHLKESGFRDSPDAFYVQENLDDIPIPDRSFLPIKHYGSVLSKSDLVTTMITSRGCPYKCTFCKLNFQKTLHHSAERIIEEFKRIEELGIREVEIYDDTFTWSKKRVMDICRGLIDSNIKIEWSVRDRVSSADFEMYQNMYKAGCRRIHLGIESGTQKVIDRMRKKIKVEQAKTAVDYAKRSGMTVLTYFMFGNLDETLEDMRNTIDFSLELDSDYAEFSITIPYAGTEMYEEALSSGLISYDYWREFAINPTPNFRPPELIENHANIDQMVSLRDESLRRFYFRPRYFYKQAKEIGSFGEFIRKAQMGLHLFSGLMNPRSTYIK